MCLDRVIQSFSHNDNVEIGWKIFKIENNNIFSALRFNDKPYDTNITHKTSRGSICMNSSPWIYPEGFHFFTNKKEALKYKDYLDNYSLYSLDKISKDIYVIYKVQMKDIHTIGETWLTLGQKEKRILITHVATEMKILNKENDDVD